MDRYGGAMSRPWFKVATRIKDDPAMIRMGCQAFKVWIFILALAAEKDADGAVCQRDDLALMLRMSDADTDAALAEIGPRVRVVKGVVTVRDWLQWQAPSRKPEPAEQVTARSQRHRKKQAKTVGNANATQPLHDGQRDGNASLELEVEGEPEEEKETTPRRTQLRRAASAEPAGPRDAMFDAFCGVWGYDPDSPGQVRGLAGAFSARCKRVAPEATPADLAAFCVAEKARQVQGQSAWGSVTRSHNTTDAFIGWWQAGITADGSRPGMVMKLRGAQ